MLMIMGTSLCHILISSRETHIAGIGGIAQDGVLPGFWGYEAGQAAVGDIYDWFVSNAVPSEYLAEVQKRNINIYDLMNEKMARLTPGASGVLALDWWNGNRSLLVDSGPVSYTHLTAPIKMTSTITSPKGNEVCVSSFAAIIPSIPRR